MGVSPAMSTLPCCTPGLHQQMGDLSARAQRSLTMFDSHDEHSAQPSDQARKTLNLVPTTFITADSSKLFRTLCKTHLFKHVLTGLPGSKNFQFRSSKNLRFRKSMTSEHARPHEKLLFNCCSCTAVIQVLFFFSWKKTHTVLSPT